MKYADLYKAVFGEELKRETYKHIPHNMKGRIAGKACCLNCGLIALNNEFSRWSIDKGCLSELHPSYKSKRRAAGDKMTKFP